MATGQYLGSYGGAVASSTAVRGTVAFGAGASLADGPAPVGEVIGGTAILAVAAGVVANKAINDVVGLVSSVSRVHGNSMASTRQTTVYQLVSNRDGAVLKYGITSESYFQDRYPSWVYSVGNFTIEALAVYPTRPLARADEFARCQSYAAATGHLPPLSLTC